MVYFCIQDAITNVICARCVGTIGIGHKVKDFPDVVMAATQVVRTLNHTSVVSPPCHGPF